MSNQHGDSPERRQDPQKRRREEEAAEETPSKRQKPSPPKETGKEKERQAETRRKVSKDKKSTNHSAKTKTKIQTIVQMFNKIEENPENFKPKFNFHLSPNPGSKVIKNSILAQKTDLETHPAEQFSQKSTTAPAQQKQLKPESKANHHPSPDTHPPPICRLRKKKVKPSLE